MVLAFLCGFALLECEQVVCEQLQLKGTELYQLSVAFVLAAIAVGRKRRAAAVLKAIVLIASTLLPLLTLDAFWLYSRPSLHKLSDNYAAGKLPATSSARRLVWIIFDEMDYHLAFEARPSRIAMPELDRLQGVAVSAEQAHAPASHTILALPSLITGQRAEQERHSSAGLALRFRGSSRWTTLSSQPNLFRQLRAAGLNSAVSGWHNPYCRLVGKDLSACVSAPNGTESVAFYDGIATWPLWRRSVAMLFWQFEGLSIERILYRHIVHITKQQRLLSTKSVPEKSDGARAESSFSNIRNWTARTQQIAAARLITAEGMRMLRDPELNLVMIHVPAPHLPGIWDNRNQQFTATGESGYLENLGFVDYFLGQVRQALQQQGAWESSNVIVSSDHPLRLPVWQQSSLWSQELTDLTRGKQGQSIPFLLKMANQSKPRTVRQAFNTVVTHQLIWNILQDGWTNPDQVVSWLNMQSEAAF